jgi:DNA-nicking Smr family endonuclease
VKRPHAKGGHSKGRQAQDHDHDSDDDVWRHTAATVEPLKRGKLRVYPSAAAAEDLPKRSRAPSAAAQPGKLPAPKYREERVPLAAIKPEAASRKAPELAIFDRNSARRIRAGRREIEARVDLHGMRQDEAHAALRRFLFSSQSRGLRFVLVITGKGKSTSSAEEPYVSSARERGILKRNVPRWLEEPELRSIVVSYTRAAIQHGGEGAIYVHLRAKDRL